MQFNVEQIDWSFLTFLRPKKQFRAQCGGAFFTHFLMPVNKAALSYHTKGHERLRARLTHTQQHKTLQLHLVSGERLKPQIINLLCTSPRCIIIDFHTICKSLCCMRLSKLPWQITHFTHTHIHADRHLARALTMKRLRGTKKGRCAHR
jgi:hypothetical protein